MKYSCELETAKTAAISAGKAIMEIYNTEDFVVEYKEDESPLTVADKRANDIIVRMLGDMFPSYAILSEESEDNESRLANDYCFIVDPLDGTKEFIKRNGQFTVNVALSYKEKPVVGVIYVPVTGDLYFAAEGYGSFLEERGKAPIRLSVSGRTSELRIAMSLSHGSDRLDALIEKYKIENHIRIGSSLKGCLIARGDAEMYYRFNPTKEWDTAAMQCIAEQAGAIFRQMDGTEMRYNRSNSVNDKGFFIVNMAENILDIT